MMALQCAAGLIHHLWWYMTVTDTKVTYYYLRYPAAVSYHILSANCWVFPWRRSPVIWEPAFGSQWHPHSPLRTRLLESWKGKNESRMVEDRRGTDTDSKTKGCHFFFLADIQLNIMNLKLQSFLQQTAGHITAVSITFIWSRNILNMLSLYTAVLNAKLTTYEELTGVKHKPIIWMTCFFGRMTTEDGAYRCLDTVVTAAQRRKRVKSTS